MLEIFASLLSDPIPAYHRGPQKVVHSSSWLSLLPGIVYKQMLGQCCSLLRFQCLEQLLVHGVLSKSCLPTVCW
jgi:hypothetical protein